MSELLQLEHEVVSLKAKLAGRKDSIAQALKKQNGELKQQVALLEEIAHSLAMDALHPTEETTARAQFERLKNSVVTYCTKSNIDPSLWKKLAS